MSHPAATTSRPGDMEVGGRSFRNHDIVTCALLKALVFYFNAAPKTLDNMNGKEHQ